MLFSSSRMEINLFYFYVHSNDAIPEDVPEEVCKKGIPDRRNNRASCNNALLSHGPVSLGKKQIDGR